MYRNILLIWAALLLGPGSLVAQKFNLGFEDHTGDAELADGWFKWGEYDLSTHEPGYAGENSARITSPEGESAFGSIATSIPAKYEGSTIRLEGSMKLSDVSNGFAGLLLRVDGDGKTLAFSNMQKRQLTGTIDWQHYSVELPYPEGAETIYVGGILVGVGTVWFDDFTVSIDGESVQTLAELDKPDVVYEADKDQEFDGGSKVELSTPSPEEIDDLELLGKVWGFLKYHHPAIASGKYNWDYQLFRFLPTLQTATDDRHRDSLMVAWIESFGDIPASQDYDSESHNVHLQPAFDWIDLQSDSLRKSLLKVYSGRNTGAHYYIDLNDGVGNPSFKHEKGYSSNAYPDVGFRLLALYRYWNIIEYFFPYRHLTDTEWGMVLRKYIPVVVGVETELEYELAMLRLIGEIGDTHANLWGGADKVDDWKGNYFSPIRVEFIEDKLVVTDFYEVEADVPTDLSIGDIITEVNGKAIQSIIDERSMYYPGSNQPTRLRDLAFDILRANDRSLAVTFTDGDGVTKSTEIPLFPKQELKTYRWVKPRSKPAYETLDGNIGYVTLQNVIEEDIPKIKTELKRTKGIIVDIRNYPAVFVPFKLGAYFLTNPTPFVKFTSASLENPGEFSFGEALTIPAGSDPYTGRLVVLVNEYSQSQAEYTAMAFRASGNSTLIGSTTAGADGNVSRFLLPGGLSTMISGIGVYYPDGEETQRVGIVPDEVVKPTIEGIRDGRDELIERAIEIILKN